MVCVESCTVYFLKGEAIEDNIRKRSSPIPQFSFEIKGTQLASISFPKIIFNE